CRESPDHTAACRRKQRQRSKPSKREVTVLYLQLPRRKPWFDQPEDQLFFFFRTVSSRRTGCIRQTAHHPTIRGAI
ncbi:MAG: hypothetical protein WCF85_15325, partial [Rhodospirillaceae bacterium]